MSLLLSRGLGLPSLFVGAYPSACPFECGFTFVVDLTKGASDVNPTYRATAISTARIMRRVAVGDFRDGT